jgi:hypothetical protein
MSYLDSKSGLEAAILNEGFFFDLYEYAVTYVKIGHDHFHIISDDANIPRCNIAAVL